MALIETGEILRSKKGPQILITLRRYSEEVSRLGTRSRPVDSASRVGKIPAHSNIEKTAAGGYLT
jgi:hypothetical protein